MKEFVCEDENVLVSGAVVSAFVAACGAYQGSARRAIARHCGTAAPEDSLGAHYYSLQTFLRALLEMQEQLGRGFLYLVGSLIYENAAFPPGIDSIESLMSLINTAYYMNHRGIAHGEIGGYHWRSEGRSGTMLCDNPYPCSFDLGLLHVSARRVEASASVRHHDDGPCRARGGEYCTYVIEY